VLTANKESSQQYWGQLKVVGGVPAETRLRNTVHALECSEWVVGISWMRQPAITTSLLLVVCYVAQARLPASALVRLWNATACGPRCASMAGHFDTL
jgi:hypothetical protein